MGWCPICKYEYREGIEVCSDCGAKLVDDLSLISEEPKEEELVSPLQMKFAFDEENDEEAPIDLGEETYVNNEERAEDNKSSAYTLLTIGVIGFIVIALFFLKVIPSNMTPSGRYMISGVMGVMFVLFIVMGFVSLKNFKSFKQKAYKENNLTAEIKKWCIENIQKDKIDALLSYSDESDEIKYFGRFNEVKKMINKQFMNLNASYVDRLIEEIYSQIFEQEEDNN